MYHFLSRLCVISCIFKTTARSLAFLPFCCSSFMKWSICHPGFLSKDVKVKYPTTPITKHEVWEISEPWCLKTQILWLSLPHNLAYSDPSKVTVIMWFPLTIPVATDSWTGSNMWARSQLRNFFSLKWINSNKYLFISISILWDLLIWISIPEFDWLSFCWARVLGLAKQQPDPGAWWVHQGNSPLLKIFWSQVALWAHLSYAHACLLEALTIVIDVLNLNNLLG